MSLGNYLPLVGLARVRAASFEKGNIVIILEASDYQPRCKTQFERLKARILQLIPSARVEHIGASAIEGAVSKGDLDIFVGVAPEKLEQFVEGLLTLGFEEKSDTLRTAALCMLESTSGEDVALQVVANGSEFESFLSFRDALRAEPKLLLQYNALKRSCAHLAPEDYRLKKSTFINEVLAGLRAQRARAKAQQIYEKSLQQGQPLAWFDELYSKAQGQTEKVPWADLEANPNFVQWHKQSDLDFTGKTAIVVGCGLGDDCEYLAEARAVVTGFDIAPSAIEWCKRRFPESAVSYETQDLLNLPQSWLRHFDFILEAYTIQVLPPDLRQKAMGALANLLAVGGHLLVICRAREQGEALGALPWPLSEEELRSLEGEGLFLEQLELFDDGETPPVRRFRAVFSRQ